MNEMLNIIKNRYSCRGFTDITVEKDKIDAIALAGIQAPSGLNLQPWKIVVVQNKELINEMDKALMDKLAAQDDHSVYERMMSRGGKVFYNAPCMYIIAKNAGSELDSGIVVENMALAASSLGLGNVICGMPGMLINDKSGVMYKGMLIPEGYEFGVALLVGHPIDSNGTPHEPDWTKIIYLE